MYQPSDLTDMSPKTLISTLISAHGEMTRFKALFILALADFHSRSLARELGSPSTTIWLMRTLSVAESTAFEYLRVGTTLARFPLVAAAFLAGELSYSVVRILAAHLTEENEAELLAAAKSLTITELRALLAGMGRPEKPLSEQFSLHIDEETGWLKFHGRISPENAARLLAGLKIAELGNLVDLSEVDPEVLADGDAVSRELEKAENTPVAVPAEERSATGFGAPRRSGLLAAFLGMVNMTRCRPTNRLRTPGAQVNLLVSEDGRAILPSIPGASSSSLVAAALNGDVRAHLLDNRGVQIAASRAQRLVGDAQVNALMARWNFQCAMPGCNHTRFMEFHHIIFYRDGGETELWNLIPLCSACHSLVTTGMAEITFGQGDSSVLNFTFAGGARYVSENRSLPMRLDRGRFREHRSPIRVEGQSFSDEAAGVAMAPV